MNKIEHSILAEYALDISERKQRGIFYSPQLLIDLIIKHTVEKILDERCKSIDDILTLRICDPSCGTGKFLVAAFLIIKNFIINQGWNFDSKTARRIQKNCLFGMDIDSEAIKRALDFLPNANLVHGDSLREIENCFTFRFDVVIGNPPYLKRQELEFVELALRLLKANGLHSFIVPKSFLYASHWNKLRNDLLSGIIGIIDCKMAWKEVRLEQVIYLYESGPSSKFYETSLLSDQSFWKLGKINKFDARTFGFYLSGLESKEILLGKKLRSTNTFLNKWVENQRGSGLQKYKTRSGSLIVGGRNIDRYRLSVDSSSRVLKSKLSESEVKRALAKPESIFVQNIVAHVQRPTEHLRIAASRNSSNSKFLILDTVNQLHNRSQISSSSITAILNSKLISWYVFNFLVGRAKRTIHFDSPITDRIPVPEKISRVKSRELEALVRKMEQCPSKEVDMKIEGIVHELYELRSKESELILGGGQELRG